MRAPQGDQPQYWRATVPTIDGHPKNWTTFFNLHRSLACFCLGSYMVLEVWWLTQYFMGLLQVLCRVWLCSGVAVLGWVVLHTGSWIIRLRPVCLSELGQYDSGQFDLDQLGFIRLRPKKYQRYFVQLRPNFCCDFRRSLVCNVERPGYVNASQSWTNDDVNLLGLTCLGQCRFGPIWPKHCGGPKDVGHQGWGLKLSRSLTWDVGRKSPR